MRRQRESLTGLEDTYPIVYWLAQLLANPRVDRVEVADGPGVMDLAPALRAQQAQQARGAVRGVALAVERDHVDGRFPAPDQLEHLLLPHQRRGVRAVRDEDDDAAPDLRSTRTAGPSG